MFITIAGIAAIAETGRRNHTIRQHTGQHLAKRDVAHMTIPEIPSSEIRCGLLLKDGIVLIERIIKEPRLSGINADFKLLLNTFARHFAHVARADHIEIRAGILMADGENSAARAPLLRVSLNAEETVTVFPALFFLSEGRRKEVKTLNGYSYLTLEQRREIERMYAEGERVIDIAARLKRSAAAIYEELKRGYTGEFDGYARPKYSADLAQATVQENFRRRGNRRGANC